MGKSTISTGSFSIAEGRISDSQPFLELDTGHDDNDDIFPNQGRRVPTIYGMQAVNPETA